MDVTGLVGLSRWWHALARDRGAEHALAALYVQLGRSATGETARFLAGYALTMNPGSHEALELLERLTPARERAERLCGPYAAFLDHAPFHRASPRVREALIDLLVECGQYDAALEHVRALTRLTGLSAPSEDIVRACSVPPPGQEPYDSARELDEFDLDPCEALEPEVDIDIDLGELFAAAAE